MKTGDKVVLVSHEHETSPLMSVPIGTVGTITAPPRQGTTEAFVGDFAQVAFEDIELRPWVKNLRPAKDYYIKQFKRIYGGN